MNFFEAQARAKRDTGRLLVLFALATLGLIVLTNLLVMALIAWNNDPANFSAATFWGAFDWGLFAMVALVVAALIGLGSLYKTLSLSGGGRAVAELLGGRLIPRNTADPAQRRLLNVVEEMAIASGIPAPPVYLLDEWSINAFAAGQSPNNAVIAVTRGTLSYLDREELEGVVAHEFSHIFNGDMRMNLRLMGILHGILLIGLAGSWLLRSLQFTRRSRDDRGGGGVMVMLGLGLGLVVIGYSGTFFGQWIKAMVSRQRELLADATAVQYTRSTDGIAGALKKIGGLTQSSLLESPAAPQYSHAYFSTGVTGLLEGLFATHPPLPDRIRRIDPRWDGRFVTPRIEDTDPAHADEAKAAIRATLVGNAVAAGMLKAEDAVKLVGQVQQVHVDRARDILAAIPDTLQHAAEEPFGARAVIYALLVSNDATVRAKQHALLTHLADPAVLRQTGALLPHVPQLPEAARLPLVGLTLPVLRTLSMEQYRRFHAAVEALITADNKIDLKEWILQHFLIRQLDEHFQLRAPPKPAYSYLGAVKEEAETLLSLAAYTEHGEDGDAAARAFAAGTAASGATALKLVPRDQLGVDRLNNAIDRLAELKPLLKPRILKACAACLMYDGRATVEGQELLRTIASCLDSPMPPLTTG